MLQQQINYWNLVETMRHNRVFEGINQQDADTNRMNANTNIWNAQTNAMNAVSNRIQAGAAVRQAGAAERQAGVAERTIAVTESLRDSKAWNNYASPISNPLGKGISMIGVPMKSGAAKPTVAKNPFPIPKGYGYDSEGYLTPKNGTGLLASTGARAGAIGLAVVGGVTMLKTTYDYTKEHGAVPMIRQR